MTDASPARIPLVHIPRRLAAVYDGPVPTRWRIYDMVTRAAIPAEHVGSRWFIAEDDLPAVAHAVGMTPRAAAQIAA